MAKDVGASSIQFLLWLDIRRGPSARGRPFPNKPFVKTENKLVSSYSNRMTQQLSLLSSLMKRYRMSRHRELGANDLKCSRPTEGELCYGRNKLTTTNQRVWCDLECPTTSGPGLVSIPRCIDSAEYVQGLQNLYSYIDEVWGL